MTKRNLKVKRGQHSITKELEYAKWRVTLANSFLNVLGVYRLPDGSIPQILDIFTELLVNILTCNTNLVVLGDFNIHVNDTSNPNVNIFLDTILALGLKQHVEGPTHKSGNCLDLIFTEELSRAKAVGCSKDMFVSDHSSISCILDIPKENCTREEITYRKLRDVDRTQLVKDMSLEEIKTGKLDDMVEKLEGNFMAAINKQTPEIMKVITDRKKKPWFTDDLKEQKRIVREKRKSV